MRFLTLSIFILWQLITPANAVSNNTYSFFWSSRTSHSVGQVTYDGGALSSIMVNVENITPGLLYVTKSQCKSYWGEIWTHLDAYDHWLFIPKSVKTTNGNDIKINIYQLPKDYNIVEEDATQYVLYKKTPEGQKTALKKCYREGESYNFTGSWDSAFILRLDTQNLSAGSYEGDIIIKIAFAEYFKATTGSSANSNPLERWSLADAKQNIGEVKLPFNIKIRNVCSINPSEINLDHSGNLITTADGHTTSKDIYVRCTESGDVNLSLSLRALNNPTTSYAEGVGVGLGNGWDSILKIENSNISSAKPTTDIVIPANSSFKIESVLKKTNNSQPGGLSGAAVMEVFLQ